MGSDSISPLRYVMALCASSSFLAAESTLACRAGSRSIFCVTMANFSAGISAVAARFSA